MYNYCGGNPINKFDPDGSEGINANMGTLNWLVGREINSYKGAARNIGNDARQLSKNTETATGFGSALAGLGALACAFIPFAQPAVPYLIGTSATLGNVNTGLTATNYTVDAMNDELNGGSAIVSIAGEVLSSKVSATAKIGKGAIDNPSIMQKFEAVLSGIKGIFTGTETAATK